jgi:nucleotide-binding universal stress UspA family protein
MPGIIVGSDGSGHSQQALTWAMKEAAVHHVPLTVLTVHQAIRDVYGLPSHYGDDAALTEQARGAAQAEVDKALAALEGPKPESVTVTAVHGIPADVFVEASKNADLIVLGSRGLGGGTWLMGSVAHRVAQHTYCPVTLIPHHEDKG